ncbi:MAG TPA: hypothetical protein VLS45_02675 [Methylomicrobium sp.]|nr:hypothetical protein [Methylomicrobium sp.]
MEELASLLQSKKIRFHLKAAICQWLGSVDEPMEEEWKIISRFDDLDGKFPLLFGYAVLSSSSAWFDLLNKKKWIEQQLAHDNHERVEVIFSWMSFIAGKKQDEIAVLLRSWWNNDPQRVERFLYWFRFAHWKNPINCCDPLFDLCEEIIRSHPAILFKQKDDNFLFSILNDLSDKNHELGERILQVIFDGWFIAHPGKLPFGDDEFKIIERHDCHTLAEFAKKAPVEFLAAATGFLVRCVDMVLAEGRKGKGWWDFKFRTTSEHHYRFDGFLKIYREALKKIAQQQSDEAEKYLQQLDPHKHECLMHLHLEAIEANPKKLSHLLPNIAQDEIVFKAGYYGADWLSFSNACKAAFPFLKIEERLRIEQDICKYLPEIKYHPAQSRYKQWCIFENIGKSLLSFEATGLLDQLRRKFRNEKIEEPNNFKMTKIKAPISADQCARMKNSHWLSAIKKYCISNNEIKEYRIHELARNLEEEASKNPERFAKFCFHIPKEANRLYIEYLILGLAKTEKLPLELTVQVVNFVHYHHLRFFGSSIATLVKKHPSLAVNSEMLEILIWYALNGIVIGDGNAESERIKNETYSIEQIIGNRSFLYQCDINGERGSAWEALSVVLPEVPQTEDRICEALEEAFEKESLVSVRCTMIRVLGQLYNINKNRFAVSIKKLIVLPITTSCNAEHIRLFPLITHTGIDLFPYIFHRLPNLAKELVTELLECGDETKELIGAWLIFGQSFRNEEYVEQAEQLAARSVNHRRLLADIAADVLTWTENRMRAEKLLKEFFFDEDKQVRKQAAHVFGNIRGEEMERCRDLAENFVQSPAFSENSSRFLRMLEEASCDVLDLVIGSAERMIAITEEEGWHDRGVNRDAHYLNDLLKREYVSSEKNPDARKRLLDLTDKMLTHNIYGVDSMVTAHDRW